MLKGNSYMTRPCNRKKKLLAARGVILFPEYVQLCSAAYVLLNAHAIGSCFFDSAAEDFGISKNDDG